MSLAYISCLFTVGIGKANHYVLYQDQAMYTLCPVVRDETSECNPYNP
jgi:hypothetical protein